MCSLFSVLLQLQDAGLCEGWKDIDWIGSPCSGLWPVGDRQLCRNDRVRSRGARAIAEHFIAFFVDAAGQERGQI
jgi:hypothetical protein